MTKRTVSEENRVNSIADLEKIKKKALKQMASDKTTRIVVGLGTCGIAAGAKPVYEALEKALKDNKVKNVELEQTGCVGICQFEPVVEVYEPGGVRTTYVHMTPVRSARMVQQHIIGGNPLAEFTIGAAKNGR